MKIVHLVFNAHLDPIWLWPWPAGLDAALATCRSACDRLDAHKNLFFSRNEAWIYAQVEQVDPGLFQRIRRHVETGHWNIVGGWWIQPDCNLPSGFAMKHQIELGKKYFTGRFGIFPKTAYNVDSFGHAAYLPELLRSAGQTRYVMMRPQEHEMALPARLFRWRGYEGGPEVVTFRIAASYCTGQLTLDHIQKATTHLPPGVEHTMCFLGVGDHGGGPTEAQIAWCRKHQTAVEGWRLEFSTPDRFFDAIAGQVESLPVVTGELQHHAIGCYTVQRQVKVGVRRAEHLLRQAEIVQAHDRAAEQEMDRLGEAWQQVCFNQFHDTLGGTCIPSAYEQVGAQLGLALAVADYAIHRGLRRMMGALPDDLRQRIVLFNASDEAYEGYAHVEPWLDGAKWEQAWRLLDERNQIVPCQTIQPEACCNGLTRVLLRISVPAGGMRILTIDKAIGEPTFVASKIKAAAERISSRETAVDLSGTGILEFGALRLPLPHLELLEDATDTWSHGVERYAEGPGEPAHWDAPLPADTGPMMASLIRHGGIGKSTLTAEYRVYAEESFVELRLRVHWAERHRLLKLVLPLEGIERRWDGVMGGELERACDGRERPLRDRSLLETAGGTRLGIVCPDVFALDVTDRRARLTLLRSPFMAHHDPHTGEAPRYTVADQGVHDFRFQFHYGKDVQGRRLDCDAFMYQRPLIMADLTRGMPARRDV